MIIHNNEVHTITYMTILLQREEWFYGSHWYVYRNDLDYEKVDDYLLKYERGKYTLAIISSIVKNMVTEKHILYDEITIDIIGEIVSVYNTDYELIRKIILRNNKIHKLL